MKHAVQECMHVLMNTIILVQNEDKVLSHNTGRGDHNYSTAFCTSCFHTSFIIIVLTGKRIAAFLEMQV